MGPVAPVVAAVHVTELSVFIEFLSVLCVNVISNLHRSLALEVLLWIICSSAGLH